MILTVGKDRSNDVVIEDESIGRYQVEVQVISKEILLMTDVRKELCLSINDKVVLQGRVKKNSKIKIGDCVLLTADFFDQVIQINKQKKIDFTEEFKDLMSIFQQYQRKKDKINKNPLAPIIVRILVTLSTMGFIFYSSNQLKPENRILLMSASGIIAMVFGSFFNPSQTKRSESLDKLLLEYEHELVCPKCASKMYHQSYTYWLGKKKCNNEKCNAIFQF